MAVNYGQRERCLLLMFWSGGPLHNLVADSPALIPWLEKTTEVAAYLWEKGWAERNAGNLSVDVTDWIQHPAVPEPGRIQPLEQSYAMLAGRYFLVTGSGHRFRDLPKDAAYNACILRIDIEARGFDIVWGGEAGPQFRPTSELPAHLRIHEFLRHSNARENVVLHTHPTELIALSHLTEYQTEEGINRALWGIHPEVKVTVPRGVGQVRYAVPGSEALAVATVEAFQRGHTVALWEMHGVVAIGSTVMAAFDLIDTLNKGAQMILMCRHAGQTPKGLSGAQLDELVQAFHLRD
jgi:rhamnulose-1-phosphate aldolase